jgi:uncharacterized repeat protein (TIGR03803 family)
MQTCRRSPSNLWRLALAGLVAIAGFASNTHAQMPYQVAASFDWDNGTWPNALIQGNDGSFYGTTFHGGAAARGTVFKIDAAGTLTTLHSFIDGEGTNPSAGLVQGNDGSFYGTTRYGGAESRGTIFKIDAAGTLTTLHSFIDGEGKYPKTRLIQGNDGSFYGTTQGNDGSFYGTTLDGGTDGDTTDGYGTIFKIDPAGTLTTLHNFDHYTQSVSELFQGNDGSFYGTTKYGGLWGGGTVFQIDALGTLTTLHSFGGNSDGRSDASDGMFPEAGLIQGNDGSFYGTAVAGGWASGGSPSIGTMFRIDTAGTLTTLHSFIDNDGYGLHSPEATLIQGSDGSFYGTAQGGAAGYGAIFKIDAAGTLTILHSFADGAAGYGGLVQASDGIFYGTAMFGGAPDCSGGCGTVFRLTAQAPTSTALTVSPNPSMFGQSVTMTASVTTASGTPTGSVAFFDGSSSLGTVTLNGGTAALTTTTLTSGAHTLHAEYAGAYPFPPSTSSVVTQLVALPATFITPANHATNVDLTQPFTWTSVAGVQAYYLYVGTSVGAKDLVNTGEIQQTSYLLRSTVPVNQTLYARLWTKANGVWVFTDRTFSVMPLIALFTDPATAGTAIDPTQPLTWTTVATAQAYYLYVGSTLGANDLVNTGEIQQTSYLLGSTLPAGQMLYARLWTKVAGIWRYVDRSFHSITVNSQP